MHPPAHSRYCVPFDGSFEMSATSTVPPAEAPSRKECKDRLEAAVRTFSDLQRRLYAEDRQALLIVFQAMDAAGKDGTIRATTTGVNPAGFQVSSFKAPSKEALDHDFLWRLQAALPQRGRIGIFNRSHYEEVLVVRVHPPYLTGQRLPPSPSLDALWQSRYTSIRDWERHLVANGTQIIKFFLNVGKDEQARRLLARIDNPAKRFKYATGDIEERAHWPAYMAAYQAALNATSRPDAPWYAIPADDKRYMRMVVGEIIVATLAKMDPQFPTLPESATQQMLTMRALLTSEA